MTVGSVVGGDGEFENIHLAQSISPKTGAMVLLNKGAAWTKETVSSHQPGLTEAMPTYIAAVDPQIYHCSTRDLMRLQVLRFNAIVIGTVTQ